MRKRIQTGAVETENHWGPRVYGVFRKFCPQVIHRVKIRYPQVMHSFHRFIHNLLWATIPEPMGPLAVFRGKRAGYRQKFA